MLIQLFLDYNGTERVAAFKINKRSQHLGAKKNSVSLCGRVNEGYRYRNFKTDSDTW